MKLIENEKIIFKDQYGNEHKVFSNKENEFMYKESVYFKNYEEATMHNSQFPCKNIVNDLFAFKPFCNFELGKDKILYENKCMNCLYSNANQDYYKRKEFLKANTLIPDIATGENGKFKYWIEIVDTHVSSEYKRSFINSKEWTVLEIHIQQIEDMNSQYLNCYNISGISEMEYFYITNTYKLYDRIFDIEISKNVKSSRKKKNHSQPIENNESDSLVLIMSAIHEYINNIFDSLGKEKFEDGQSLDYTKVLESIQKHCDISDISIYGNRIDKYLRKEHSCSILSLQSETYPIETVEKYGFKKVKSIIHSEVSERFRDDVGKIKKENQ